MKFFNIFRDLLGIVLILAILFSFMGELSGIKKAVQPFPLLTQLCKHFTNTKIIIKILIFQVDHLEEF